MSNDNTTRCVPLRGISLPLSSWTMICRSRNRTHFHVQCPRRRPRSRPSPAGCLSSPPCEQPNVVYRICLWRGPARRRLQAKLALRSGDRKTVAGGSRRCTSSHHHLAAAHAEIAVRIGGFASLVPWTPSIGTRHCCLVLGRSGTHPCQ